MDQVLYFLNAMDHNSGHGLKSQQIMICER